MLQTKQKTTHSITTRTFEICAMLKLHERVTSRLASLLALDNGDLLDGAIVLKLLSEFGLGDFISLHAMPSLSKSQK